MVSDKVLFSMDLSVLLAVEELAKDSDALEEDILISFMQSRVAEMIYDDSTKLWWASPLQIAEDYKDEMNGNKKHS